MMTGLLLVFICLTPVFLPWVTWRLTSRLDWPKQIVATWFAGVAPLAAFALCIYSAEKSCDVGVASIVVVVGAALVSTGSVMLLEWKQGRK